MIAIPFHDCQHKIAQQIEKIYLGKAFLHEPHDIDSATALGIRMLNRSSLTTQALKNAILEISNNIDFYKENIKKIKEIKPQSFVEIIENILQKLNR
jgi:hypothetical protein